MGHHPWTTLEEGHITDQNVGVETAITNIDSRCDTGLSMSIECPFTNLSFHSYYLVPFSYTTGIFRGFFFLVVGWLLALCSVIYFSIPMGGTLMGYCPSADQNLCTSENLAPLPAWAGNWTHDRKHSVLEADITGSVVHSGMHLLPTTLPLPKTINTNHKPPMPTLVHLTEP